jgi:hypothetical protein
MSEIHAQAQKNHNKLHLHLPIPKNGINGVKDEIIREAIKTVYDATEVEIEWFFSCPRCGGSFTCFFASSPETEICEHCKVVRWLTR